MKSDNRTLPNKKRIKNMCISSLNYLKVNNKEKLWTAINCKFLHNKYCQLPS